jgi:hypothetical protein
MDGIARFTAASSAYPVPAYKYTNPNPRPWEVWLSDHGCSPFYEPICEQLAGARASNCIASGIDIRTCWKTKVEEQEACRKRYDCAAGYTCLPDNLTGWYGPRQLGTCCQDGPTSWESPAACRGQCVKHPPYPATFDGNSCTWQCWWPCGPTCCKYGETCCYGSCVNLQTNNTYCGGCGAGYACTGGKICCNGKCLDWKTDNANCGGCGRVCPPPRQCVNGNCICPASGDYWCGDSPPDPAKGNCCHMGESCLVCSRDGTSHCIKPGDPSPCPL